MSLYPQLRLRRLRRTDAMRRLVQEHHLTADDLIWPVFVEGEGDTASDIATMKGVQRYGIQRLVKEVKAAHALGIPAVALFPKIHDNLKDEQGSHAFESDNLVCKAVAAIKAEVPEILVICDVALDPYTSHGQDGVVEDGVILNDQTVASLCEQALVLAQAGADIVAPSDMMDGRVGAIRATLDNSGFEDVAILAYSAKYASAFYGPFRDAVGSAAKLGAADKKTYQMNPANRLSAFREVEQDIAEGADMVMVKPGMPYLDVLRDLREAYDLPILAYQVSGEYAMLVAASEQGALHREAVVMESLMAFKRAGANAILTYFAREVAEALK